METAKKEQLEREVSIADLFLDTNTGRRTHEVSVESQRRILASFANLGITSDKPFSKDDLKGEDVKRSTSRLVEKDASCSKVVYRHNNRELGRPSPIRTRCEENFGVGKNVAEQQEHFRVDSMNQEEWKGEKSVKRPNEGGQPEGKVTGRDPILIDSLQARGSAGRLSRDELDRGEATPVDDKQKEVVDPPSMLVRGLTGLDETMRKVLVERAMFNREESRNTGRGCEDRCEEVDALPNELESVLTSSDRTLLDILSDRVQLIGTESSSDYDTSPDARLELKHSSDVFASRAVPTMRASPLAHGEDQPEQTTNRSELKHSGDVFASQSVPSERASPVAHGEPPPQREPSIRCPGAYRVRGVDHRGSFTDSFDNLWEGASSELTLEPSTRESMLGPATVEEDSSHKAEVIRGEGGSNQPSSSAHLDRIVIVPPRPVAESIDSTPRVAVAEIVDEQSLEDKIRARVAQEAVHATVLARQLSENKKPFLWHRSRYMGVCLILFLIVVVAVVASAVVVVTQLGGSPDVVAAAPTPGPSPLRSNDPSSLPTMSPTLSACPA